MNKGRKKEKEDERKGKVRKERKGEKNYVSTERI